MYHGRLAPSPTGLLHLGHARTFALAQDRAVAAHGRLSLRVDDLDAARIRPAFDAAMREDLHWLGLVWHDEVRQSARLPLYREALDRLIARGRVYPCTCSRRDLAQAVGAPHEGAPHEVAPHEDAGAGNEPDDEPVYNNRCRPQPGQAAPPAVAAANYRLRVPDGETIRFHDQLAGAQQFVAGVDFGDFLVFRKDGLPSYQLACVVDDAAMQITEVVRGRDLLKSTARQMLLQRALGYATPAYAHSDLVRDAAGVRLAKRHDALALRTLRERGMTPDQVRAMF